MKIGIAALLVLSSFATSASAVDMGTMKCRIKDQKILQISDGQASQFNGYSGDLSTGDNFQIEYFLENFTLTVALTGGSNVLSPFSSVFAADLASEAGELEVDTEYHFIKKLSYGASFLDTFPMLFLHWRPNKLSMSYLDGGKITLERYYKGDWMGMYTEHTNLTNQPTRSHIFSFDCKHDGPDKLSDFFEKINEGLIKQKNNP